MALVSGPLGEMFGRDPAAFCVNAVRSKFSEMIVLTERCAKRTGVTKWTTKGSGGKAFSSRMVAHKGDSPPTVALIVVLWALKNPNVLVDEARRFETNMPIGKSLDTYSAAEWRGSGQGGRSFLGIDDAIALVGLISAIIGLASVALPVLIPMVQGVAESIDKAVGTNLGKLVGAPPSADAGAAAAVPDPGEAMIDLGPLGQIPESWAIIGAAGLLGFVFLKTEG
jgi:hypothetical protein